MNDITRKYRIFFTIDSVKTKEYIYTIQYIYIYSLVKTNKRSFIYNLFIDKLDLWKVY